MVIGDQLIVRGDNSSTKYTPDLPGGGVIEVGGRNHRVHGGRARFEVNHFAVLTYRTRPWRAATIR